MRLIQVLFVFLLLLNFFVEVLLGENRDLYKILGVEKNADINQIKKAYRRLAKELHPDRAGTDPEIKGKFENLGAAYEVLSDPEKRKIYDKYGEDGLKKMGNGRSNAGDDVFSSFFGDFFGGAGGGSHSQSDDAFRGADVVIDLFATLEEIYNGNFVNIARVKSVYKPTSGTRQCNCRTEMRTEQMGAGRFQMYQIRVCDECPNVFLSQERRNLEVEIETGVEDGHELVFFGEGEPHIEGEPGDLKLKIRTQKHSIFERRGSDLYTNITISLHSALIGFELEIKHLDGHMVKISREKVTWPGARIRKNKEGMPHYTDNTKRGDLFVTFDIEFPRGELLDEQRTAIERVLKQESFQFKTYNGLRGY